MVRHFAAMTNTSLLDELSGMLKHLITGTSITRATITAPIIISNRRKKARRIRPGYFITDCLLASWKCLVAGSARRCQTCVHRVDKEIDLPCINGSQYRLEGILVGKPAQVWLAIQS